MVRRLLTDLEEVNKQLDQMYVLLYLSKTVCQFLIFRRMMEPTWY
jgi:hypothetical protein